MRNASKFEDQRQHRRTRTRRRLLDRTRGDMIFPPKIDGIGPERLLLHTYGQRRKRKVSRRAIFLQLQW
jgi:hypothetical protein